MFGFAAVQPGPFWIWLHTAASMLPQGVALDGDVRMHDPSTIIQAGVSDHMWKVEEIVGLLEAK